MAINQDIDTQKDGLSPYQLKLHAMLKNRRWIADNIDKLMETYMERWIVVNNCSVVSDAETAEAAVLACGNQFDEVEAIVLMVPGQIARPI